MSENPLNRRQFYRINCQAQVQYKTFNNDDKQLARDYFDHGPSFYLLEQLITMDIENNRLLAKITNNDRSTGNYLKFINKKIETIASLVVAQNHQQLKIQHIEISEGGCTIHTSEHYPQNQTLAVSVLLLPQHIGICCYAQVIECTELKQGFKTTLSFDGLSDGTQDMIARLVLQHQAEDRRRQQNKDLQ